MRSFLFVAFLLIVSFFFLLPQPENKLANGNFILRNVQLYDGNNFIENTDVMIRDNRINTIARDIDNVHQLIEIDGHEKTLIPGLIDSHTHAWGDALEQALNFAVTTELDMFTAVKFSQEHQQSRDKENNINDADLFSATILATAPHGHGTEYGINIPVLSEVEEVEQFVSNRVSDGADYIKVVYNAKESKPQFYPSISYDILAALIASTHQNNKLLVVHTDNQLSAKHAIELGADGLVHSFMDSIITDELVSLMLAKQAFIIPTLSVEASIAGLSKGEILAKNTQLEKYLAVEQKQQLSARFPDMGISNEGLQNAKDSIKKLHQAGVVVLAGTDAPNPGTSHGISIHGELELLVAAGLTAEQALHSATGAVGKVFPIGERGVLQPGTLATMVLLEGNPTKDINATKAIDTIWKNGSIFKRRIPKKVQHTDTLVTAGTITDFNNTVSKTNFGQSISETTDQIVGGKSTVSLSLATRLAAESDLYLHIKGELKPGFSYPWSGFAFVTGNSYNHGINLSQLRTLVFDAKAGNSGSELTIMLFQAGSFQPSIQKVTLNDSWQTIKVDLASFEQIDLNSISNISFVSTVQSSSFEFMVDNLKLE